MKYPRVIALITTTFTLVGCMAVNLEEKTRPAVSAYNGTTVSIQANGNEAYNTSPTNDIMALATSICGKAGKKAEYTSTKTSVAYYRNEHLFLCL